MHEKRKISFGKCRLGKGQVFNLFYTKGFSLGSLKIFAHLVHSSVNSSFFVHLFVLFTCHILIACEWLRFAHKYSNRVKSRVVGIQVTTRRNHVTFTLQTPISFSLVVICCQVFCLWNRNRLNPTWIQYRSAYIIHFWCTSSTFISKFMSHDYDSMIKTILSSKW